MKLRPFQILLALFPVVSFADPNLQGKLDQLARIQDKRSLEYQTLAVDVAQDLIATGKEALDGKHSARALQYLSAGASLLPWRTDVVELRRIALARYVEITNNLISGIKEKEHLTCKDIRERVKFLQKLAPDSLSEINSYKDKCQSDSWGLPSAEAESPLELLNQVVPKTFATQEESVRVDLSQELDYITARNTTFPTKELEIYAFAVWAAYFDGYEENCNKFEFDYNTTDKSHFTLGVTCQENKKKNEEKAMAAAAIFCGYAKKQLEFKCLEKVQCFDGVKTESICTTKPIAEKYREFSKSFNARSVFFQTQYKDRTEGCYQKPDLSRYSSLMDERPVFPFEKNVRIPTMVGKHKVVSDSEKVKDSATVVFAFSPELSYSNVSSKLSVVEGLSRKFVASYKSEPGEVLGKFSEGLASVKPFTGQIFFVNTDGEVAFTLPESITAADDFKGGISKVRSKTGSISFIDQKGNFLGENYRKAGELSEGLIAVWPENALGCSYLSVAGGLIMTPPVFERCEPFSGGLAAIRKDGLLYYIDRTGQIKIEGKENWESGGPFREGLAAIRTTKGSGYIDESGHFDISPKFYRAYEFSDGLALVQDMDDKTGYINRDGSFLFEPVLLRGSTFKHGLATVGLAVGKNSEPKIGFVDTKGKLTIFAADCTLSSCPITSGDVEKTGVEYISRTVSAASVTAPNVIKVDFGRSSSLYNVEKKEFQDVAAVAETHFLTVFDLRQCMLENETPNTDDYSTKEDGNHDDSED